MGRYVQRRYFCSYFILLTLTSHVMIGNDDDEYVTFLEQKSLFDQEPIRISPDRDYEYYQKPENSLWQDDTELLPPVQLPHKEFHIKDQQKVVLPELGNIVILTNPIGLVTVLTMVATVVLLDRLAQMKIINSCWSFAQMKEKICGTTIYKGDEYYKNWRNPKNLDRKFPKFFAGHHSLPQRAEFEREMSECLVVIDNLMKKKKLYKSLPWPDDSYEKILDFKFYIDPIYISENEEYQLNERLTAELAQTRASVLRSVRDNIAKVYAIFESLANEIISQLKNVVKDFKAFKIDPKFLMLLACIVLNQSIQGDESNHLLLDPTEHVNDLELCCAGMNKKSIVQLFTHASEYLCLLEDFEKVFDCSHQYSTLYRSKIVRFIQNHDEHSSVEETIKAIKDQIIQKKLYIQRCLQEITYYCKQAGQAKILPDLVKFIKKMSRNRFKKHHKNSDDRSVSKDIVTFDLDGLLTMFLDNIIDDMAN